MSEQGKELLMATTNTAVQEITIAHSPDTDDAFMFFGLHENKVETGGVKVNQVMKDIQSLNIEAQSGRYEVSAISFAAYPKVRHLYKLMCCGSSMGENYGPMVVTKPGVTREDLKNLTVAIPGKETSAYLTMRLWQQGLNVVEVPFDQIVEQVLSGKVGAGLIIHESQLTYAQEGLHKIVDLGVWWQEETGLPLPLGGNAVRKDLGEEMMQNAANIFKSSVVYALEHRREALHYAMSFARDMDEATADKFVTMYVNELTVDCGDKGREAVRLFFQKAYDQGIYDELIVPEFVV
jgi:1,4-dihydroxy-6-naphthoate synthase